MSAKGIAEAEIALIKAMLARGKGAGFTAQKILSYFSRPERTINVARLYEIRDGTRGADILAASEAELHWFLASFSAQSRAKVEGEAKFRYMPAPAYIGVSEGRVCLLDRRVERDDERVELRRKLLSEQYRLATSFAAEWSRFQIDQRLKEPMEKYASFSSMDHFFLNIFALDDEFRLLRRSIGTETGGFGEIGEAQWDNFCRNHVVLTELYPEMREYRAELAAMKPKADLAEEEARQATAALRDPESHRYVAPEVPDLIQRRLDEDTGDDPERSRKRAYDVAALLNMTGAMFFSLVDVLPKLNRSAAAAISLRNRLWPLLRTILEKMEWL